jgi:hypothetical protein
VFIVSPFDFQLLFLLYLIQFYYTPDFLLENKNLPLWLQSNQRGRKGGRLI